jgi:hypothetical protein
MAVFWVVMPCGYVGGYVGGYWCFEELNSSFLRHDISLHGVNA